MTKYSIAAAVLFALTACESTEQDGPIAVPEDSSADSVASPDTTSPDTTSPDTTADDTAIEDSGTADTSTAETATDSAMTDTREAAIDSLVAETTADTAVVDSVVPETATDSATVVDSVVPETASDGAAACVDLPAPTCNAMAMPASATFVTSTLGAIPAFTRGGALPDGTYVLIKQVKSSGTVVTFKDAFQLFGGCLQDYSIKSDATEVRANAKIATNPTTGAQTFAFTCPTAASLPAGSAYGTEAAAGGKVKLITLDFTGTDYREWMQQ